ncbi:MAG: hypothetical protein ACM37W_09745 [Actinomycetota bacterium]
MKYPPMRRAIAPFLLTLLLLVTACEGPKEPSRWDRAQQESTQKPKPKQTTIQTATGEQKLPSKAVGGGSFNKFFPAPGNGFQRVYTQEKSGFAEAKLKKGGKDVAMLSINDLASNPSAAQKFKDSTKKIAGYPAVQQGSTATALLVANRYQVKVQSRDATFTASDREAWLQKFNLSGLAQVK